MLALLAAVPVAGAAFSGTARALAAGSTAARIRKVQASAGRMLDVWTWSSSAARAGTIAFSHGFGSSPRQYLRLIHPWLAAGYDVLAPLHAESTDNRPGDGRAGTDLWASRIEDMRAVAGLIEGPYFAAGHSFGALGALVLGGAAPVVPQGITGPTADDRVRGVIALSPPPPAPALITAAGYATLARPALIQTGTRDLLPAAVQDPQSWRAHLAAFAFSSCGGDRHALVLEGADHYFGGLICDARRTAADQRTQLRLTIDATRAFLAARDSAQGSEGQQRPAFPAHPQARFYWR